MTPTRILITSDLHYGVSAASNRSTEALARHVVEHQRSGDLLLLGGDLGASPETLDACLELFREFRGPKLAVPGNHDVWLTGWESHTDSSWALHETLLPEAFTRHDVHPLHLEPWVSPGSGELAVIGSMGWYDFSFRDLPDIPLACYRAKTPPWSTRPIWNDARFCRWPMDDEALSGELTARLERQLHDVTRRGAQRVIALVHHLVCYELLVHPRDIVPKRWRFANAFLGSAQHGEVLFAEPRVRAAVCGHIHLEREARRDGCWCVTVGSDYETKQLVVLDGEATCLEKRTFAGDVS